ncbi:hypothetical protein GCM10025780_33680 [Frondihabitans cladoniiphilus]|uniref:Uncharacterized protein n=1 Tax=Frondihabitans cladoniiphilus TaxID=715785 RepID=A0ABP8WBT1_9MICO
MAAPVCTLLPRTGTPFPRTCTLLPRARTPFARADPRSTMGSRRFRGCGRAIPGRVPYFAAHVRAAPVCTLLPRARTPFARGDP